MLEGVAGGYGLLVVFGTIVAIAWVVLPFALIGTKPILKQILREERRTNAILRKWTGDGRISEELDD